MIRLTAFCFAATAAMHGVAAASCESDYTLQKSLVHDLNAMPAADCKTAAQQAVVTGMLQQLIEARTRLDMCPGYVGGTPVAELQTQLRDYSKTAAKGCRVFQIHENVRRDVGQVRDAMAAVEKQHREKSAELQKQIDELDRKIRDLQQQEAKQKAAAEKNRENQRQASARQNSGQTGKKCNEGVAQMKVLSDAKGDPGVLANLKAELKRQGCKVP